jgi:hypothetical protein
MILSMQHILEQMNGGSGSQEEKRTFPAIELKEAQRAELETIRKQIDGKSDHRFLKWDEVEFVHRTSALTDHVKAGCVIIFWKYLNQEEAMDRLGKCGCGATLYSYPNPDCLIGFLSEGGFVFYVVDSTFLRLASDQQVPAET